MNRLGFEKNEENLFPDQVFQYRGYELRFKYDQARKEWFTDINSKTIYFGQCNSMYLQDAKLLIDYLSDTIADWPEYPRVRLY